MAHRPSEFSHRRGRLDGSYPWPCSGTRSCATARRLPVVAQRPLDTVGSRVGPAHGRHLACWQQLLLAAVPMSGCCTCKPPIGGNDHSARRRASGRAEGCRRVRFDFRWGRCALACRRVDRSSRRTACEHGAGRGRRLRLAWSSPVQPCRHHFTRLSVFLAVRFPLGVAVGGHSVAPASSGQANTATGASHVSSSRRLPVTHDVPFLNVVDPAFDFNSPRCRAQRRSWTRESPAGLLVCGTRRHRNCCGTAA